MSAGTHTHTHARAHTHTHAHSIKTIRDAFIDVMNREIEGRRTKGGGGGGAILVHRCVASNKLRVKSPGHLKTTYIRALMDAFSVGAHSEGVSVKLWCTFRFMSVSCSLCLCVGLVVTRGCCLSLACTHSCVIDYDNDEMFSLPCDSFEQAVPTFSMVILLRFTMQELKVLLAGQFLVSYRMMLLGDLHLLLGIIACICT